MNDLSSKQIIKESTRWLRLIPFGALGGIVFVLNSSLQFNYIIKGYLVLLEAQAGIVIVYFLLTRIRSSREYEK